MKFKILQNILKEGLDITSRTAGRSVSLPILKNILLKTEGNFIILSATDLETAVRWWSLSSVNKEGEITVPLNIFSNFISLLPEEEKVEIEKKKDDILIKCKEYKTEIKGLKAEDFPVIPLVKDKNPIKIKNKKFFEGLKQIGDIPSSTKVKPEISGVYFSFQGKELKMAATDSYRLAEKNINLSQKIEKSFSFILPQKAAKEIINIFREDEEIEIKYDGNQVLFQSFMEDNKNPRVQLISKLIEGDYPDYQSIIPKEYKTKITLDKEEMLKKVKAASLFSGRINEVTLKINPKKKEITILSQDSDLGNYETIIKGEGEGEEVEVSFNYRFLLDGIGGIKSSQLTLETGGENSPGKIDPVGVDDFLYVVMPIKKS